MRTLKKTLSLVLVVAMVLGLCVVGASATNKVDGYEDAGKIGAAYTEAVGVMTGLGIVDGVTDTELRPENTYQRDQAAKIIAYMLLGKNKADSLSCTVAPFEDVPANHWAAGYIAFCKEQGIIDGVTETTFKPTGTLTGFQWAKMLLCAVGFGYNGEFEGDTWSLNTSKVAHTVDLFAGDLAGADHVALQRQQAMLYAFNALTSVKCVVWSEALGDYIYKYNFADRYTYTGTLGANVWKLYSTTGLVVDNEGMGGPNTMVQTGAATNSYVKADTGLDLMWHAAKIWYTGAETTSATSVGTGVYVMDLATTKNSSCKSMDAIPTGYAPKTIGNGTAYERALVDNPTGYNDYAVTFSYNLTKLGARSEAADQTVIVNYGAVKNAKIKTDISAINNTDAVLVLRAESSRYTTTTGYEAYYVYALTATAGNVASYSAKTGAITLTDGTVLYPSAISTDAAALAANIAEMVGVLAEAPNSKPAYVFTLDTHGHYMMLSNETLKTVAYFTGTYRLTSSHDAWYGEAAYTAQFALVKDGTIVEAPVTAKWIEDNANKTVVENRGYFDITDELYLNSVYYPNEVTSANNIYGNMYALASANNPFTVTATSHSVTLGRTTAYYDYDTVTYYVATGFGSTFEVKPYVGNAALLAYYADKNGASISSVTIPNAAMYMTKTVGNNYNASSIFIYDTETAYGGIVFFPKTVIGNWVVTDSYFLVGGAYVDGAANDEYVKVASQDKTTVYAGFYNYTVTNGIFTLIPVKAGSSYYWSENKDMVVAGNPLTKAWLKVDGNTEIPVDVENVKVIDLRSNLTPLKIDTLTELADLLAGNYNEYLQGKYVDVAAVVSNNKVVYFYVVDGEIAWNDVQVTNNVPETTYIANRVDVDGVNKTTITISSDKFDTTTDYTVNYTIGGVAKTATAKAVDGKITFDFVTSDNQWEPAVVVIKSITFNITGSLDGVTTEDAGTTYAASKYYHAAGTVTATFGEATDVTYARAVSKGDPTHETASCKFVDIDDAIIGTYGENCDMTVSIVAYGTATYIWSTFTDI